MGNENEFVISGVVFVSAENNNDEKSSCIGCAMHENRICPPGVKSDSVPNCHSSMRKDGRNVIFVENHP